MQEGISSFALEPLRGRPICRKYAELHPNILKTKRTVLDILYLKRLYHNWDVFHYRSCSIRADMGLNDKDNLRGGGSKS